MTADVYNSSHDLGRAYFSITSLMFSATHRKESADAELLEELELGRALVAARVQQLRHLVAQLEGSRLLHCTGTRHQPLAPSYTCIFLCSTSCERAWGTRTAMQLGGYVWFYSGTEATG
jgi:hypothetical protein